MRFLLIHGGWQGGWCWDSVVAELGRRGHEAYAPTLPGFGPDETDRTYRGMRELARHAAGELVTRDVEDVVVVGHSGGGPIAQAVVEQGPARVRQVVFVDAFVLTDGMSIFDDIPAPMVDQFTAVAAEADARRWLPWTVALPISWLEERVRLATFATSGVSTGYVFLADDKGLFDRAMFERQAARLDRLRVATCRGGHEAMLTQPVALTDALLEIVEHSYKDNVLT